MISSKFSIIICVGGGGGVGGGGVCRGGRVHPRPPPTQTLNIYGNWYQSYQHSNTNMFDFGSLELQILTFICTIHSKNLQTFPYISNAQKSLSIILLLQGNYSKLWHSEAARCCEENVPYFFTASQLKAQVK